MNMVLATWSTNYIQSCGCYVVAFVIVVQFLFSQVQIPYCFFIKWFARIKLNVSYGYFRIYLVLMPFRCIYYASIFIPRHTHPHINIGLE